MSKYHNKPELANLTLGQVTEYSQEYDPSLLQAVPRSLNRLELNVVKTQPFVGEDVWYGYELSWLNLRGKPVVAVARFRIPADSVNLVESKSFKLYLNSFNQTRFANEQSVREALTQDLSACAEGEVVVELFGPDHLDIAAPTALPGYCLDELDIAVEHYDLDTAILENAANPDNIVSEVVHSHLLKSNCLITNQPDWASVVIEYQGAQIDHEALLRYLISFRQHNEFHEQCVERIFVDISHYCQPQYLAVQALYTRRGGLDINPYRYSKDNKADIKNAPVRRINRQ